jgi:hypothetical protein
MRQGITIFLLIVVALILLPLIAFASPPDPSWIAGIYDGADGDDDDIVILVYETAATNAAALAKIGLLPCLPGISLERIRHGSPGARFTRGPRSPPGSVFYLVRSCFQLLVGLHAHCIRHGSSSYPRVNHQVPPVALAISISSRATKSCDHLAIGTLPQSAQRERTPFGISRRWAPRRTTRTASAFGGISIHLSNRLLP